MGCVAFYMHLKFKVQPQRKEKVRQFYSPSIPVQRILDDPAVLDLRYFQVQFQKFAESWTNRAEPPDFCYFTSITSKTHLKYEARTKPSLCRGNST